MEIFLLVFLVYCSYIFVKFLVSIHEGYNEPLDKKGTVSKTQQTNYYTLTELSQDFTLNRVDKARIPANLQGYYSALKKQQEKRQLQNANTNSQKQQNQPSPGTNEYYQMRKNVAKGYWRITPEQIRAMSWREFETFIAHLFEGLGYDVELTSAQNDEGKDVIARKDGVTYYIECKHWKKDNLVGRVDLQKLIGAAASNNIRNVIFIATSGFHDNAKVCAKDSNLAGIIHVELWNMNKLLEMANSTAVPIQTKML